MVTHHVGAHETPLEVLEEIMQSMTVRKVWVLTQHTEDIRTIKDTLMRRDYAVADGALPTPLFMSGYHNTLVTDWDSYANDQQAFACILTNLDVIVLEGMSELDQAAWSRWVENNGGLLSTTIVIEA
jgi:hypothetical protein